MVTWVPLVATGVGLVGLSVAGVYALLVMKADPGSERMQYISRLIQRGAMTFISREYRYVAVFLAAMALLLGFTLKNGWLIVVCYLFGAAVALFTGFAGLRVTTSANARTTEAARRGVNDALKVAFRGGSGIGLAVTSLGLVGVAVCFVIFESVFDLTNSASTVLGFALGAATVALFLRVGGGIFTKGADVGADLVGKVEEGIPEDDPRNPAVIADNVGDNVGDVAGMGSDLSASFIAAMAAPIVVASSADVEAHLGRQARLLPLAIGAAAILCTILGTLFVRRAAKSVQRSLILAIGVTTITVTAASFMLVWGILGWSHIMVFIPLLTGIIAGICMGLVSGYFTSSAFGPVRRIGTASESGAGLTVIAGMSEGMISTIGPAIFLGVASAVAFVSTRGLFAGAGFFGVSLTGIGMLSIAGIIVATDSFGCVADNAGGIAEMTGAEEEVRERTDVLDAVGNTTAAISKGFAIGAAALVSISLLAAYSRQSQWLTVRLIDENTILGLVLGAMVPLAFGAMSMKGVQKAASTVVEEVRRQFREIPGLREGVEGVEPDYSTTVDMTTREAVHAMLIPAVFVFVLPLGIGLILGLDSLAGFIVGVILGGFVSGVWMVNAGGAWDNAKKYIETGQYGGKGSFAHACAVVGDTVGDPLKDTAGPSMNIVIKVMALTAVIFIPLFH